MKNGNFEEMARQAYVVDWVAAACMACLLYDHVLTFGQEVERMWPARCSIPKLLFFANRYIVEPMLLFNSIVSSRNFLSIPVCKFYLRWLVCTITVTTAVVEGILVARVWAIYRTQKTVLAATMFFYLSGVCTLVGLTITDYAGESVSAVNDFDVMPGCYSASVPPIIAGYWITPVIVESVLFALIAVRGFVWLKDKDRVPAALVLLARDSTVYYMVIFALLIANLFVFEYGPPFLSSMMVTPSNTAGCIAGSRMLLNLRALAFSNNVPTDMETTRTGLHFAPLKLRRLKLEVTTGMETYPGNTLTSVP
ncbi:hypothetical protein PILCRDRAFT_825832 [Piloderma croceum F 1598]|uniref:DUF6533 domain-containing protein n=1 Tax=Piloderma croceum (strain F 1598) TaxID=765440 RepID=A0A0C3FAB6_PILCF|nr:hypothetical protein PILCRDRAFT_825832 [Piloderma croceum F 1598]